MTPEDDAGPPPGAVPHGWQRPGAEPAWAQGWWQGADRWCASPNHGIRPPGMALELAVIHSISLPPGQYGGLDVPALFLNRLDTGAHPYYAGLVGLEVSAHFWIRRDGEIWQFVDVRRRAWHAGRSSWRGRENCNDYSVGIELEGLEGERFERGQYQALVPLLQALRSRWGIAALSGHEHVAPGRKQDPGPGFDWTALQQALRPSAAVCAAGERLPWDFPGEGPVALGGTTASA
ncbi:1,6-anhydro-N-acetylmuramyl-L-alanine amidase AmpD [Ideonella livida]|uniref:1,6-anhydro-N-acetylmuramyl-L-alanine amidase AmpD n=1 Tax=Ideonella livida TaxID=2707176 RepID=A0A7C9TLA9_9BURK|nr:1,6-anhydro-N-acetylmuramyl-L-alanine amidase AmpD [Ideonella livida]NDY93058.1 1,6-anhydro-N-acetylmuramyl-L-alanine amidase AmpD [Ideonella livida]